MAVSGTDSVRRSRASWTGFDRLGKVLIVLLLATLASAIVDAALRRAYPSWGAPFFGSTLGTIRNLARGSEIIPTTADSWRPMKAALVAAHWPGPETLYDLVFFKHSIKFQYPPTSLLYLNALEHLGLASTQTLNTVNAVLMFVNIAIVILVFRQSLNRFGAPDAAMQNVLQLVLFATVLFLCHPVLIAFAYGQIQIWLNLIFSLACLLWLKDRKFFVGLLVGIGASIKPQFAIFAVWALLWREWSSARGFFLSIAVIGGLSLLLFGVNNHLAYLKVLSFLSLHGEAYYPNNSVNGLVNRLLFNGNNLAFFSNAYPPVRVVVATATYLAAALFLLTALLPPLLQRKRAANIFDFGILAICSTLSAPIAWEHHYGVMLPLFAIALARLLVEPARPYNRLLLASLVVAWALSANFLAFLNLLHDTLFNFLQSYLFFAGLTLLAVFGCLTQWDTRAPPAQRTVGLPQGQSG